MPVRASIPGHVRCGQMTVAEGTWHHREICVKAKRSCEGGMSARDSNKKMDDFTLRGYLGCVLHVIRQMPIYMCRDCVNNLPLASHVVEVLSFVVRELSRFERERDEWICALIFLPSKF